MFQVNPWLFSSKDKSKIIKMSSAAILFGALRINLMRYFSLVFSVTVIVLVELVHCLSC